MFKLEPSHATRDNCLYLAEALHNAHRPKIRVLFSKIGYAIRRWLGILNVSPAFGSEAHNIITILQLLRFDLAMQHPQSLKAPGPSKRLLYQLI